MEQRSARAGFSAPHEGHFMIEGWPCQVHLAKIILQPSRNSKPSSNPLLLKPAFRRSRGRKSPRLFGAHCFTIPCARCFAAGCASASENRLGGSFLRDAGREIPRFSSPCSFILCRRPSNCRSSGFCLAGTRRNVLLLRSKLRGSGTRVTFPVRTS